MNEKHYCTYCNDIIFNNLDDLNSHNVFFHPIMIVEGLYLGNMFQSSNMQELKRLNITCILNCAFECKNHFPDELEYCNCELDDDVNFPIENYFDLAVNFINASIIKCKRVLVHCKLGRSRSASIIIAYLIIKRGLDYPSALKMLTDLKSLVTPNNGFIEKLKSIK